MCRIGRLGGYAITLFTLIVILAGAAVAIESSRVAWPQWLKNDWAKIERNALERAGGQLSGFIKAETVKQEPFGLLIGASTTDCGIDTEFLEKNLIPYRRWIRMIAVGSTTCELESLSRMALDNGLKPDVLAVCIDLRLLARSPNFIDAIRSPDPEADSAQLIGDLKKGRIKAAATDAESIIAGAFNKIFADRKQIKSRLNSAIIRTRMSALQSAGQNALTVFPPVTPEEYEPFKPKMATQKYLEREFLASRAKGQFDPELYSPDQMTFQSLQAIVRMGRNVGAQVLILVMPESSHYRERIPANASQAFRRFVAEKLAADAPIVLDFRDAVPDSDFLDWAHLSPAGRARFTSLLTEKLQVRLGVGQSSQATSNRDSVQASRSL